MTRLLAFGAFTWIVGCGALASQQGSWEAAEKPGRTAGREVFDLRAVVDGAAEFTLRGASVSWRQPGGDTPRDDGSSLTAPLPEHVPEGLEIRQLAGRNRLDVIERPSAANDWSVVLRIDDRDAGEDSYHVQFSWELDEAEALTKISPVLLEQCQREVQMRFQKMFPQSSFAWDEHDVRPAGVLAYLNGEATAAREDFRMRVAWECFVDPRRNAVREADFEVLSQSAP